jgi:hypothetical protein
VCNNKDSFGAGFSGDVAKHYPIVETNYHILGQTFLNKNPGYVQFVKVYTEPTYDRSLIIANMIAQNGIRNRNNKRPLNYAYLVKSMFEINQYINRNINTEDTVEIHCPKFGSGLAGGNWKFIECLIEDIWGKHKVVVYGSQQRILNA